MYEIGDKVIYQGADKSAYKKVGVLKSIEEKDGKPQLTVEFEGGETFTAPVDDWSKEFTNACRNAKFKVGDKVTDGSGVYLVTGIDNDFGSYEWKLISGRGDSSHSEGGNFGWADSKMKIVNACKNAEFKVGDRVYYKGKVGVVERANSKFWYDILVDDELLTDVDVRLLKAANSCRSTNSVVRNAMAANRRMARNGESEQREIVEMNIDSLKKDLDKVVRGLDETKRWMGKYGDNRIASIDKAKGAVVQAIQQLKY